MQAAYLGRHSAHLIFLSIACTACSPPAPAAPWNWATVPPLPDELKARAPGNNAFAFDLFAKLRAQKGNLALSPFNVATTLTIAWAGARGETAAQIQKVLHLDLDGTTDPVSTAGRLTAAYRDPALQVTSRFANVLFTEYSYDFQEPYSDPSRARQQADLFHAVSRPALARSSGVRSLTRAARVRSLTVAVPSLFVAVLWMESDGKAGPAARAAVTLKGLDQGTNQARRKESRRADLAAPLQRGYNHLGRPDHEVRRDASLSLLHPRRALGDDPLHGPRR